ncbi:MAG: MFS transporter [Thermoplasmata archaeon]|nr:MFS transporter [Thermoplasmata archaeon]
MNPMLSGPPAVPPAPPRARGLLRNRNYGLYLVGNIAGWGGLAIADVLFIFLVFNETGSAIAVAYVGIVEALPAIAVGLPAGVLADRYDRRLVLVITSLLQGGALGLILGYLYWFGFHLGLILLLIFALETVTVVFRPSSNALLPSLVDAHSLDDANGVVQAATSVAATVGSAAAAVLLVLAGMYTTFLMDTLVLVIGGLLFAAILGRYGAVASTSEAPPEPNLRRELGEAIRYLRRHPPLVQLTAVSVASGFFVEMFSPFLVVYTVRTLSESGGWFGYLLAGFSAGFFAGSLVIGRLGLMRDYGRFFAVAMIMSGLLLSLLVLVPSFPVALGALTGVGMLLGLVITGFTILVQRIVPSELLGRYLGLDETLTWAVAPLGILAGGILAETVDVRFSFAVAVIGLVGTGVIAYALRGLRSIGYDARVELAVVPPGAAGGPVAP